MAMASPKAQRSSRGRGLHSREEINITNNAELRANTRHILTVTRESRPKNTALVYQPKQEEFKVNPLLFINSILIRTMT